MYDNRFWTRVLACIPTRGRAPTRPLPALTPNLLGFLFYKLSRSHNEKPSTWACPQETQVTTDVLSLPTVNNHNNNLYWLTRAAAARQQPVPWGPAVTRLNDDDYFEREWRFSVFSTSLSYVRSFCALCFASWISTNWPSSRHICISRSPSSSIPSSRLPWRDCTTLLRVIVRKSLLKRRAFVRSIPIGSSEHDLLISVIFSSTK